jgi:hypothetical protein
LSVPNLSNLSLQLFLLMIKRYVANEKTMKRGQGLAILGMSIGKVIRNNIQGLGDLGEARRVIIAHAEHEAKTRAQHQFRLFRPPNFEVTQLEGADLFFCVKRPPPLATRLPHFFLCRLIHLLVLVAYSYRHLQGRHLQMMKMPKRSKKES